MPEQQPLIPLPTLPSQGILARRIRFVAQLPAETKSCREFRRPRTCHAFEEAVEPANLPRDKAWPEPTDSLHVLYLPKNAAAEWQRFGEEWMMAGQHPEAVQPIAIQGRGRKVYWRPGRALIQEQPAGERPDGMPDDVLAALIDFSFHEAELRNLELQVKIGESSMYEDVNKAYTIRYKDRKSWPRFTEMIEYFSRLILAYSLLEPRLLKPSRTLPRLARRWVTRLCEETDIDARLEDVSDRLEIGEALYQGANDRVSDYKGYHFGHVLEVIIVGMLVMEVVLMSYELMYAYQNHQMEQRREQRELKQEAEKD